MYTIIRDGKKTSYKSSEAMNNHLLRQTKGLAEGEVFTCTLTTIKAEKVAGKVVHTVRTSDVTFVCLEVGLVRVMVPRGLYNERGFYWTLRFAKDGAWL